MAWSHCVDPWSARWRRRTSAPQQRRSPASAASTTSSTLRSRSGSRRIFMADNSVVCIAKSEPQAIRIVEDVRADGFPGNDISVLFPDKQGSRDFAHEQHTKAPEGATAGAVSGGALGAVAGYLVGIGALAIPGLGPF